MSRLVRVIDGDLHIAESRVAGPGYVLYVNQGVSSNGWTHYVDNVVTESFAHPWKQPAGAHDAYAIGVIVSHDGSRWRSTIEANVWEPGVSGWKPADGDVPAWIQPTGAHDSYQKDAIVTHSSKTWVSLIDANVWVPGVSSWRETALMPPTGEAPIPAWVQPTGGHDAYAINAVVTHNGKTWKSTVNNNVWAPGVYGWVEV